MSAKRAKALRKLAQAAAAQAGAPAGRPMVENRRTGKVMVHPQSARALYQKLKKGKEPIEVIKDVTKRAGGRDVQ